MSAMITKNSVSRSVISGQHIGRGRRAMQMKGRDSGSRFSARGSQATKAMSTPAPRHGEHVWSGREVRQPPLNSP